MRQQKGEERIVFEAGDVRLEGGLTMGSGAGRALVCHPHPVMGGNMDNKVVLHLVKAFAGLGMTVLRFNFRGVGLSSGSWDEGRGEVNDAQHAFARLEATETESGPLVVAGYSFGSYAGLVGAGGRPSHRVAVAPPFGMFDFDTLDGTSPKSLLLVGENDPICPPETAHVWAEKLGGAEVRVCGGADHFFHGGGRWIRSEIQSFFK